ncbi:MAG: polyphosphate polymerase domain-containing protein [Acidimicrobiia bacterium]
MTPNSLLGRHPAISLAELEASASLLTRVDRKYLVPAMALAGLADVLPAGAAVLEIDGRRTFTYRSVYFDTDRLDSYLGAARSRQDRFKVRTRTYADSGGCVLEVKTRGRRGATVKHRLPYAAHDAARITPSGAAFVERVTGRAGLGAHLRPVLVTSYRRTTVVAGDGSFRLTIDDSLRCEDAAGAALLPGHVIVETKSAGPATAVDRWLWRHGCRPASVSKFGTGLGALHPQLPSNKWHRLIATYFSVRPAGTSSALPGASSAVPLALAAG